MLCPKCEEETSVKDSRLRMNGDVHRRRVCLKCDYRFSTREIYITATEYRYLEEQAQQLGELLKAADRKSKLIAYLATGGHYGKSSKQALSGKKGRHSPIDLQDTQFEVAGLRKDEPPV